MTDPSQQNAAADAAHIQGDASVAAARAAIPPTPPLPSSSDPGLAIVDGKGTVVANQDDLFQVPAAEALRFLCASVELLVRMTGDIPPTPPPKTPSDPQMTGLLAEKENIVRSHSHRSLARIRQQAESTAARREACNADSSSERKTGMNKLQAYSASLSAQLVAQQHGASSMPTPADPVDGVQLRHRPESEVLPYVIVNADCQPLNLQHGIITRKFYSRNEPPIPITEYLLRLHDFCPMSTAVYLATSLYIHRLAVQERAIPVTNRNAHRLVLAALRVAMKALEDLSYSHHRFAKVGGVSEAELSRLEINFCFLTGFELVVGEERLWEHWEQLRGGKAQQLLQGIEVPALKLTKRARETS
ncbi:Cyclin PHO80-like protein [Metarhizium rileyi]|uniref:Cyclin PHO80-like protein n=1 Tax=Metarhizium rileyi (strain RCEF 4871) TaxID=1649241 RepID=A0A162JX65_METRR|nr:Cyclin PHO80-like protein [Metarhizium rileyi RCEF 4871]TWU73198.1 hypothetical protein ED733_004344 [Metarhizium rileyi]